MSLKHSILQVKFEDFANLPSRIGDKVSRRITDSNGNHWKVELYPGGDETWEDPENEYDGAVDITLQNVGGISVSAKATFIVRNAMGGVHSASAEGLTLHNERCGDTIVDRSDILNDKNKILLDGALLIDVHLQFPLETNLHVPPNPLSKNMLTLLESADDADVSFDVRGKIVTAHKVVIKANAPLLYSFCQGNNNDDSPIPISNMEVGIFKMILRYIYAGEVEIGIFDFYSRSKDIIEAANRFGLIGLKLQVESALVKEMVIETDNVSEWLLFADAMTCPLLKEYAISFAVARATDLLQSDELKELKKSPQLMEELMMEMSKKGTRVDERFNKTGRNMTVNELRTALHIKGLDVDGSKEMLVSRLQANKRQKLK